MGSGMLGAQVAMPVLGRLVLVLPHTLAILFLDQSYMLYQHDITGVTKDIKVLSYFTIGYQRHPSPLP